MDGLTSPTMVSMPSPSPSPSLASPPSPSSSSSEASNNDRPPSPETPPPPTGDSSVLSDVLQALDRERTLRASLEDKLRVLTAKQTKMKSSPPPSTPPPPSSTLDPQSDKELIELLTSSSHSHDTTLASLQSSNSFLSSKITSLETSLSLLTPTAPPSYRFSLSSPSSLPPSLILSLETDPFTTLPHVKKTIGIWEWEGWDSMFSKWSTSQLPRTLKDLKLRKSKGGLKGLIDGVSNGSRNYTFEDFKERFNEEEVEYWIEDGGGVWGWVGGWLVDKNRYGADGEGWIRGESVEDVLESKVCGEGGVRGRYFERVRVLKEFPEMSKGAAGFLRELEQKCGLEVACKEMGEQVREMCDRERLSGEKIERLERVAREVPALKKELEKRNREYQKLLDETQAIRNQHKVLTSPGLSSSRNSSASNSSEDVTSLDSKSPSRRRASSGDGSDWMKRIGRGGIVEKIGEGIRSLNNKEGRRSRAGSKEAHIDLKELEVDLETNL
ncbi:hypothetical protein TrVE_jg4388 [Triparma verrucosa]|uniref:Uncharacterized protein n=1 Tax=Triparma verrucosa TaxID=1606542 RepID=A0A9W7FD39_9STRA|nr:hypothetical protein TrVE_jg4388 [Triparma verrucosa]